MEFSYQGYSNVSILGSSRPAAVTPAYREHLLCMLCRLIHDIIHWTFSAWQAESTGIYQTQSCHSHWYSYIQKPRSCSWYSIKRNPNENYIFWVPPLHAVWGHTAPGGPCLSPPESLHLLSTGALWTAVLCLPMSYLLSYFGILTSMWTIRIYFISKQNWTTEISLTEWYWIRSNLQIIDSGPWNAELSIWEISGGTEP